jgi:radical SAM protein with 4Fe4S-binding SPASM domain
MQIINNKDFDNWLPKNKNFTRYRKNNNEYTIKNALGNHCLRLWLNPVVTWDGKVVPCCFDKDAEEIMGDLNENTFRTIWNGEKYKIFRDSVLKERKSIEICRNCTSGLRGVRY